MATTKTMKTKTEQTAAAAASQAAAAQQQTTTAQPNANSANQSAQIGGSTGEVIRFAKPKAERAKSDRPFCSHTNGKGERCQLRVLDGRDKCVNHVPAEERLTEDEAKGLMTLVEGLTEAQQIRMLTRAIGWFKVKQMVSEKPEGDVILNELIGG